MSRELTLLDLGVKPSVLTSKKAYEIMRNKFGRQYYTVETRSSNMVLLFADAELQRQCEENPPLDWYSLGITLGYPPLACTDFIEMAKSKQANDHKMRIDYHGICFVCKKESVESCIRWMEEHRPIPQSKRSGIKVFAPESRKRNVVDDIMRGTENVG